MWSPARIRILGCGGEDARKYPVHEGLAAWEAAACDTDAAFHRHYDEGDTSIPWCMVSMS